MTAAARLALIRLPGMDEETNQVNENLLGFIARK
jgi:hypothetical protein